MLGWQPTSQQRQKPERSALPSDAGNRKRASYDPPEPRHAVAVEMIWFYIRLSGGFSPRFRRRRRWRRRRRVVGLVLTPLIAVVLYSYVSTMLQPSSLPLGIRSIEWMRANGAAWIVNDVERVYYQLTAPDKGGPGLHSLPRVGRATLPRRVSYEPRPVRPVLRPPLAGEGAWRSTGHRVAAAPPVLVTTYRPDPSYPRMVAYVAWIDHSRTSLALYPGRYEPRLGLSESMRWPSLTSVIT